MKTKAYPPAISLASLIIKRIGDDVYQHFFAWNSKSNPPIRATVQLVAADGSIMNDKGQTFSIKKGDGPYLYIDATSEATGFQYWTASLIKGKSSVMLDTISENREDLRQANAEVAQLLAQRQDPEKK